MKPYLFIYLFVAISCASAQPTFNELTPQEFESIAINGKTLNSVWMTEGVPGKVAMLFGSPLQKIIEDDTPGALSTRYKYDGLDLSFSEMIPSNGNLTGFEISESCTLTIKGISIKIGDDINKLGSVNINDNTDGGRSILFMPSNEETIVLYIDFNLRTKLITKIGYFVLT